MTGNGAGAGVLDRPQVVRSTPRPAEPETPTRVVLVSHGSPDPRHAESVRRLAGRLTLLTGWTTSACFLQHDEPTAGRALLPPNNSSRPPGSRLLVLPLLLTSGGHWHEDLPAVIGHHGERAQLLPPPAPTVIAAAIRETVSAHPAGTRVVVASAGSARPGTRDRFTAVVAELGHEAELAFTPAEIPALATPGAVVVPALVADGVFGDRIRSAAGGATVTAVLGDTPGFARALARCLLASA